MLVGMSSVSQVLKSQINLTGVNIRKQCVCFILSQVEENVAAVRELEDLGMDQETLSEVEAILEPVKNQTWPSGVDQK